MRPHRCQAVHATLHIVLIFSSHPPPKFGCSSSSLSCRPRIRFYSPHMLLPRLRQINPFPHVSSADPPSPMAPDLVLPFLRLIHPFPSLSRADPPRRLHNYCSTASTGSSLRFSFQATMEAYVLCVRNKPKRMDLCATGKKWT